jgi:hypothetical protein
VPFGPIRIKQCLERQGEFAAGSGDRMEAIVLRGVCLAWPSHDTSPIARLSLSPAWSMIPKSGNRFSGKIVLKQKVRLRSDSI